MKQALRYFMNYWESEYNDCDGNGDSDSKLNDKNLTTQDLSQINIDSDSETSSEITIPPAPPVPPSRTITRPLTPPPTLVTPPFDFSVYCEKKYVIPPAPPLPEKLPALPTFEELNLYIPPPPPLTLPAPPTFEELHLSVPLPPPAFPKLSSLDDFKLPISIPSPPPILNNFEMPTPIIHLPPLPDFVNIIDGDKLDESEKSTEYESIESVENDKSIESDESNESDDESVEEEVLTSEDFISITDGKPFCVENGQLYTWNTTEKKWELLFDLLEWDDETMEWVEFKGNTEDACEYLGITDVEFFSEEDELDESEANNSDTNESEISYKLLDEDVEREEKELSVPLLSDYDKSYESDSDIEDVDENDDFNKEQKWTTNPIYEQTEYFRDIEEQYDSCVLIIEDFNEYAFKDDESESKDVLDSIEELILEIEREVSDMDDTHDSIEDIESTEIIDTSELLNECILTTSSCTEDLYTISESDDESESDFDFSSDDVFSTTEEDDNEDLMIMKLYDKWLVVSDENMERKFGVSEKSSFGELYAKYRFHIEEFESAPCLFYTHPLSQKIKAKIEYIYEQLIAKFLINIFIKCDYQLMDSDMMVCDSAGNELFEMKEFVIKYLQLINKEDIHESIIEKIVQSPRLPHIAKVYTYTFEKIKFE
jgi:hypothetical protein